jgi:hypothetical protein
MAEWPVVKQLQALRAQICSETAGAVRICVGFAKLDRTRFFSEYGLFFGRVQIRQLRQGSLFMNWQAQCVVLTRFVDESPDVSVIGIRIDLADNEYQR